MAGADTPFEAGDAGAIDDLDAFLGDAIARRVFPGAVAAFGRTEGPVVCRTAGHLTYEPDDNYCNNPPGGVFDTFTYTLNGGSTATVSMTVNCVEDLPTAVADSATVAEDASATAIDVLLNDTDPDGGTKVIASASDPAHGTVVLTGGSPGAHTGLTYEQARDKQK